MVVFVLSNIANADTAFVNVTVIPMTSNTAHSGYTVLVQADRIVAMGLKEQINVPEGMTVIDGTGKYLMPGFTEMHGHLPSVIDTPQQAKNVLFLYVANGITTVRGMQGAEGQFEIRNEVNKGELIGPTLYLAGPSLNGNRVESAEHGEQLVREQKAAGWDSLKIHEGLTVDEYDAITRTATELGMRYGGHVPNDVGAFMAMEKGQNTIDHLDNYLDDLDAIDAPITDIQVARAVNATKVAGTAIVPTQALWKILYNQFDREAISNYEELIYMPKDIIEAWFDRLKIAGESVIRRRGDAATRVANRDRLLKAFSDNGIPIMFGTDAPQIFSVPGFSIHHEIEALQNAGLSDYTILKAATASVGDYYKTYDSFGTVATQNRADLLLLNSNPLEDARRIKDLAGVMIQGRWISKSKIDDGLTEIAASYR
jgi:imidazolonepropionase-like amidohydrolase